MKKILIILGLVVLVIVFVNSVNIKSNFSYKVSNGAKVNIKSGAGNFNLNSSSEKDNISGYLNRKIFTKPLIEFSSNTFNLVSNKMNGELNLPNNVNFSDVTIISGAGNTNLNLKDSNIYNLSLTSGASNIKLVLPQNTSSKFEFIVGSGNLDLVIPTKGELDGIRIISASLSNTNLGEAWVKTANGFETKDFAKAKITSIIDLSKGGSVNLDITAE